MPRKPNVYIYDPDGNERVVDTPTGDGQHIPREGELVYASDHTDGSTETYDHDEMWRVTEVQTEYRRVDEMKGGESWKQLIYVKTEDQDDSDTLTLGTAYGPTTSRTDPRLAPPDKDA